MRKAAISSATNKNALADDYAGLSACGSATKAQTIDNAVRDARKFPYVTARTMERQ